jgi:hypothetical protein
MDCEFAKSCEESIRREPLVAIGIAAAAGAVLTRLPVFAMLRPALGLVRPALIILGGWKAVELLKKSCDACPCKDGPSPISEAVS